MGKGLLHPVYFKTSGVLFSCSLTCRRESTQVPPHCIDNVASNTWFVSPCMPFSCSLLSKFFPFIILITSQLISLVSLFSLASVLLKANSLLSLAPACPLSCCCLVSGATERGEPSACGLPCLCYLQHLTLGGGVNSQRHPQPGSAFLLLPCHTESGSP